MIAALACSAAMAGCVNIELDPEVDYIIMEFDTETARIPEPNAIMINQETGLIDFSAFGLVLPEDCVDAGSLGISRAQCEFYQFLEGLDGFPTLTPAKTPASGVLEMDTVSIPSSIFILEDTPRPVGASEVVVEFDTDDNYLSISPIKGWNVGKQYIIAARGYDEGIKGAAGERVISSQVYFLLKQEESLMCGAEIPSEIPDDCKYLQLLLSSGEEAEVREQLAALERMRLGYVERDVWDILNLFGNMSKENVAIVWGFPIHTASVAELNPGLGMIPEIESSNRIVIPVKGSVDNATVRGFHPVANVNGGVYLIDLTELMAENELAAFPIMNAFYDDSAGGIAIETDAPLTGGHMYLTILSTRLRNADGKPFAASPVSVFLRSRGELVDGEGNSLVSELADDEAVMLEEGRSLLQELLDNEDFQDATRLTQRESIVYIFPFTFPDS